MENEISLPDRPNSPSTPPRKTQMSHESAVAIYSRMRPHEFTRGRALVQNLFLILSRPRPRKKRRIPVPRFRSLKLLVLQDSVFSKGWGGGEPFREYFMGTAVWKNRFNRTYQRGGKGEREEKFLLPRKKESKLFFFFFFRLFLDFEQKFASGEAIYDQAESNSILSLSIF